MSRGWSIIVLTSMIASYSGMRENATVYHNMCFAVAGGFDEIPAIMEPVLNPEAAFCADVA